MTHARSAPLPNPLPAAQGEGAATYVASVRTRVEVLGFCAEIRRAANHCGLDDKHVGELSIVIAELGTNAVLHGRGGSLSVALSPDGWAVEAVDDGPGFSPAVLNDAGHSDHLGSNGVREPGDGGRSFGSGLAAVRRLSSSLRLQNPSRGARVVADKHLFKNPQGAVS